MTTTIYKLGGAVTDDPTIIKRGMTTVGTVNHYMTFEFPVGTDYQVTAGKTLIISKLYIWSSSAVVSAAIFYGDDAVPAGAAPPTTPVQVSIAYVEPTANQPAIFDVNIQIPAEKFPAIQVYTAGGVNTQFEGIEV